MDRIVSGTMRMCLLAMLGCGLLLPGAVAMAGGGKAAKAVFVLDPGTGAAVDVRTLGDARILELRPGDVQGSVTDASGSPLGKLEIQLLDPATGKTVEKAKTNKAGEYAFKKVREGQYVVVAGSPGVAVMLNVTAKAKAEPASVNFVLPAAATAEAPKGAAEPLPILASISKSPPDAITIFGGVILPGAVTVAGADSSTPPAAASTAADDPTRAPPKPPPVRPPLPPVLSPIVP